MDSMRSLNSSLPSSRPNRSAPPEELLQAFRSAALSVTNLYKSAATSQQNARQAGYQDALEDLLKFLDKENLGLQDGEGWRVRQWATARYDGTTSLEDNAEDEDEQQPEDIETRSRDVSQEGEDRSATRPRTEEPTTATRHTSEEDSDSAERPTIFQFSARNHPDNTMQTDAVDSPQPVTESSASNPDTPIRVEVINRNSRPTSRTHHARHNTYANPRDFTFTAGSKRKLQFPDFFDISNINDGRDGSSGGSGPKRGRFA